MQAKNTHGLLETHSAGSVRIRGFYGRYHMMGKTNDIVDTKVIFHGRGQQDTEPEVRIEGRN
jgi:hypothetical protein